MRGLLGLSSRYVGLYCQSRWPPRPEARSGVVEKHRAWRSSSANGVPLTRSRSTGKDHHDGLRSRDLLHGLVDGTDRAGPRAGRARLRIALGVRALAHPALAPVTVSAGRRPAEEVLRRDGPVRDTG